MAAPKKKSGKTSLKASHYYAIGKVSSKWAWLEWSVLRAIADMTDMELTKVIMLIGHMPITAWLDVLSMAVVRNDKFSKHSTEIDAYLNVVADIYVLRNKIVHPLWLDREGDKVSGYSIPKKGRKIVHDEGFTSQQMKEAARVIAAAQLWLIGREWLLDPMNKLEHMERLETLRQSLYVLLGKKYQRRTYGVSLKQLLAPRTR